MCALSSSQVCFCLLFPYSSVLLNLKGDEELPGFPPPHQEGLVVLQGAADLILLCYFSPALLQSLSGDRHCVMPAETGSCSDHPFLEADQRCPPCAANSSTCSQNTAVLEREFLGKLMSRGDPCGVTITCHNFICWGTKTPHQSPSSSL